MFAAGREEPVTASKGSSADNAADGGAKASSDAQVSVSLLHAAMWLVLHCSAVPGNR